jgi:uncharacterized RDD family membrane protein YckC
VKERIKMNDFEESIGVIYDQKDYAGFLKRVVIAFVDLLIIILVSATVFFASDYLIYNDELYINFNFFFTLFFSVWYLALLKRSKYGTIGYNLTGVKIVDLKGEKPALFKMVLRVLLSLIGPFELIIDIIWLTSEITKQTLRDKYIGTYVIAKKASPVRTGNLQTVSLGFMGWNLMYREIKENDIK